VCKDDEVYIGGKVNVKILGDAKIDVGGDATMDVTGKTNVTSIEDMTFTAPNIKLYGNVIKLNS